MNLIVRILNRSSNCVGHYGLDWSSFSGVWVPNKFPNTRGIDRFYQSLCYFSQSIASYLLFHFWLRISLSITLHVERKLTLNICRDQKIIIRAKVTVVYYYRSILLQFLCKPLCMYSNRSRVLQNSSVVVVEYCKSRSILP